MGKQIKIFIKLLFSDTLINDQLLIYLAGSKACRKNCWISLFDFLKKRVMDLKSKSHSYKGTV